MLDAGFAVQVSLENICHEATFNQGGVDIDLHWSMFRPGRTRITMTQSMIERDQRIEHVRVASDIDAVLVMLIQPTFSEYVGPPRLGLLRVADFLLWVQRQGMDWEAVFALLEQTGLKIAAWTQLFWFRLLMPAEQRREVDAWITRVHLGGLRSAYLRQWLERDLTRRWWHRSLLIQLGLTLALHDRPGDLLHALHGWYRSRRNRSRDERLLLG